MSVKKVIQRIIREEIKAALNEARKWCPKCGEAKQTNGGECPDCGSELGKPVKEAADTIPMSFQQRKDGWYVKVDDHDDEWHGPFKDKFTARKSMTSVFNVESVHEAREMSVPDKHQLKIAKDSIKMPDAMLGVMGGPSKEEAKAIIKRIQAKYGIKAEAVVRAMKETDDFELWGDDDEKAEKPVRNEAEGRAELISKTKDYSLVKNTEGRTFVIMTKQQWRAFPQDQKALRGYFIFIGKKMYPVEIIKGVNEAAKRTK